MTTNKESALLLKTAKTAKAAKAVVFIGHGSRQEEANQEFEALVQAYRKMTPQYRVSHGYIELAKPCMDDAIAEAAAAADEVVVAPLLLFRSGHAKDDLPLTVSKARRRFPQKRFLTTDVLGVHPQMIQAACRQTEKSCHFKREQMVKTGAILIGRGSADADANGDFWKLTRLFAERQNFSQVLPCFTAIARPFLPETLAIMAKFQVDTIVVQPYLLFNGILVRRIEEEVEKFCKRHNWISTTVAQPLGKDIGVLEALADRIAQAEKERPLPCDNCHYRLNFTTQE